MENPTITAMRAKHAAEVAKAERHLAIREAVTLALGLDESNWTPGAMHAHRADCFVSFKADTLQDALERAERMDPVALAMVKAGGTSFVPLSRVPEKDSDNATLVAPWTYRLHGIAGYPEARTLSFYVQAGDYIAECRVEVAADPLTRRVHIPAEHDSRGRVTRPARWDVVNSSGHFHSVIRWWSSPGQPNDFTLYSY